MDLVTDDDRRGVCNDPEMPQRGARVTTLNKFDAGFFAIHKRQADHMDPMMRILLETAVEAIMDAGVNPSDLAGTKTGVFIGAAWSDMEVENIVNLTEHQTFTFTGYQRSLLAQRISYFLKLKGPGMIVDTACSSSMNALEHAFKAIRTGQCENAIVGSSNIISHPGTTQQFFRLGVLSLDGSCKVFDESANGYVRGEAVTALFLQKAKFARRAYAEIIHTKVNSDGFKPEGITFPSSADQSNLISDVLEESGVQPDDLSFMEAHGTGTVIGDPQEVAAIDNSIAKKRRNPLWIGSVKCNVGHSEPSSGICSIIKVIIAMEGGYIPPNINVKKIRGGLQGFEEGRLKVVLSKIPLEGERAIVAINNFGFGGNNCQLLLRRWGKKSNEYHHDLPRLVCVSGRTAQAVSEMLNEVIQNNNAEFIALIHNLFSKSLLNHSYRSYTVVSNEAFSEKKVVCYSDSPKDVYISFGELKVFANVIGKYLARFEIFKLFLERVNSILQPKGLNIIAEIMAETSSENDLRELIGFVVQLGLVDIFKSLKLEPKTIYGEGTGKIVCAYMDEVIDLEEAVRTVFYARNKILPTSSMANIVGTNAYNRPQKNFRKNPMIIDICDEKNGGMNVYCSNTKVFRLLEIFGSLYQCGHDLQIQNLYPQVEFPVSRGTPMISPLIKWNHEENRKTYVYGQNLSLYKQKEYGIVPTDNNIEGHVIDGRNLIPAICYLYLVWGILRKAGSKKGLVFENCKFRKAVALGPNSYIRLLVTIGKGDGTFEVAENNDVVVTGRVTLTDDIHKYQLDMPATFEDEDSQNVMDESEIYRELYLRGYDYKGAFRGVKKYNIDTSKGLIKWEDNWVNFIDKMLQVQILELDTRLLYVPVEIERLSIDIATHTNIVQNLGAESVIPVVSIPHINTIKAGGIEIRGIEARSILRRRNDDEPVLEKNVFVPNEGTFNLQKSVRTITQIILENSLEQHISAVENVGEYTKEKMLILPEIKKALEDIPLVSHDFVISSKTSVEGVDDIKVDNVTLTPVSNFSLIIGSNFFKNPALLQQAFGALSEKGFVLSREEKGFIPPKNDCSILTVHSLDNEKLVLLSSPKSRLKAKEDLVPIKVSSYDLSWLSELKTLLQRKIQVLIYSQNEPESGILGFTNCIRREPGSNKVRCFFIMDDAPSFDPNHEFYKPQVEKNFAINVYKAQSWGTYRHLLLEPQEEVESEHCYVNATNKGDLSSLRWIEGPLTLSSNLPKNRILISNYYGALNFRDVMIASGRIGPDVFTKDRVLQQYGQGLEFAGRDLTGRRVLGMGVTKATSSLFDAPKYYICPVPDHWSLEEAATVPVVYSTAIYALLMRTTLRPGKSILIHAGAGGVGIAAINVALYHKCEVFVTVGTKEKREFIRKHYQEIKESHIGNSRDSSFEEMIKRETQGRGVDIILNSLSEEKMQASLRCLAKGGDFCEIGKFDLSKNTELQMLLMEKQANFHGIMLDALFTTEDDEYGLTNALKKGISLGYVKPLPATVFEKDQIVEAVRFMAAGKHIGKVLIRIRAEEEGMVVPKPQLFRGIPSFFCDKDKTYVIVGGLGGFGLELTDWLILRGAKKLVLVSRNGVKNGYQYYRTRIWKSYGVSVTVLTADVTTKYGCFSLLNEANKEGPVDAIFNLAVVLEDGLLENQTKESFETSLAPKATATKFLDEISRKICPELRTFVVFSSVSCGRGNAGQTNYGMANSVMERICERRKADGLPALAIQWGAVGDVGLVAQMQKDSEQLDIGGTLQQKISNCLEVLDNLLRRPEEAIVSSMVVAEKKVKRFGSAVETIAAILGIKEIKGINPNTTLPELGMDSMTATEIGQMLEKDFEIVLTAKNIRELTFGRLFALESEKKSLSDINKVKTEEAINILFRFKPNNSETPIVRLLSSLGGDSEGPSVFFLPGAGGETSVFEQVARHIKAHVYALQYKINQCRESIHEIAEMLLPVIKESLTNKHFNIVSYSLGTVVGVELVRLLERDGFSGNMLAIDGSPKYVTNFFLQLVPLADQIVMETEFLCMILSRFIPLEVLNSKKKQLQSFGNIRERLEFASTLMPHTTEQVQKDTVEAIYKRLWATVNYKWKDGKKISSSFRLCKSSQPILIETDYDYGYSEICEKLEVETLEGNHETVLENKHLRERIEEMLKTN